MNRSFFIGRLEFTYVLGAPKANRENSSRTMENKNDQIKVWACWLYSCNDQQICAKEFTNTYPPSFIVLHNTHTVNSPKCNVKFVGEISQNFGFYFCCSPDFGYKVLEILLKSGSVTLQWISLADFSISKYHLQLFPSIFEAHLTKAAS